MRPLIYFTICVVTTFCHIDYVVAQPTTYSSTTSPVTTSSAVLTSSSSNESVFAELEAKVDTFFLELDSSTPKTAFENLLRGGPLADNATSETIDTLRTKLTEAKIQCGRYRGRERIKADAIGADLVLMRFLYKCDRFPIVWYISFYRTPTTTGTQPGQWTVISVRFDMNLEVLAL